MGTVCNLEQHTFPKMIEAPGQELAQILGEPLPESAQLTQTYKGRPRLVMPTARTSLSANEPLNVTVAVLAGTEPKRGFLYWRRMGPGTFANVPLGRVSRATYSAQIPASDLEPVAEVGIEYYLEMELADGARLHWPATAPDLNQTVTFFDR